SHLRRDQLTRLYGETVRIGTQRVLVELPGHVVLHRTHAGAQESAVGQDQLRPALDQQVIAVGRAAEALRKDAAGDRSIGIALAVEQKGQAGLLEMSGELAISHARLDPDGRVLLVYLQHAVHTRQVDRQRGAASAQPRTDVGRTEDAKDRQI